MEPIEIDEVVENPSVFSESEISEMENIFRDVVKDWLDQEFYQDLATSFNSSTCRIGKPPLTWQQVQRWFEAKLKDSHARADGSFSRKMHETSIVLKGGTAAELADLSFEAKSSRDNAWYDVAAFMNYRVLSTGELEARVNFAGLGNSHDEWVNVRSGVREHSIPLEPSECHKFGKQYRVKFCMKLDPSCPGNPVCYICDDNKMPHPKNVEFLTGPPLAEDCASQNEETGCMRPPLPDKRASQYGGTGRIGSLCESCGANIPAH